MGLPMIHGAQEAPWFLRDPMLKLRHQKAMAERFPGFRWVERAYPQWHAVWRGYLRPFSEDVSPGVVASCLHNGHEVIVFPDGHLEPAFKRYVESIPQAMGVKGRTHYVEIFYLEPPAIPLVYVQWLRHTKNPPPHTWFRPDLSQFYPSIPENNPRFACVMAPHIDSWSWEEHTAVRIVEYAAIWLANAELWEATGVWWGPEAGHNPSDLNQVGPSDPCWCGSGLSYRECHGEPGGKELFVLGRGERAAPSQPSSKHAASIPSSFATSASVLVGKQTGVAMRRDRGRPQKPAPAG